MSDLASTPREVLPAPSGNVMARPTPRGTFPVRATPGDAPPVLRAQSTPPAPHDPDLEAVIGAPSLRRIALASVLTLGIGVGGLFGWAATTSLESAVMGVGSFVAEGRRKTVTLLEPGILRQLAVNEGDEVRAGQVLFRLDVTQAEAAANQARALYVTGLARISRLTAEQAGHRTLTPPVLEAPSPLLEQSLASAMQAEQRLFAARWAAYNGSLAAARRHAAQYGDQIRALGAQKTAASTRLGALRDELAGVNQLLANGFATRTRALELRRNEAEALGSLGQYTAQEAQARELQAQAVLEAENLNLTRQSEIARDLQEANAATTDAVERLRAAQDVLNRREVTAPEAGTVTDIKYFTPGSSIGAGQPVLDLVPEGAALVVEVRIAPNDIEQVAVGQHVNVRLSAFRQREVPLMTGRLTYVSADRQTDPQGSAFFLARAVLNPASSVEGKEGNLAIPPLAAGMPAEVFVLGEKRTVLDYLLRPLRDSLRRALRD
ncbi:HlyD family type I secretion periplasmic adaptor subunit [Muricoccus vinaceus]|uniref:Membrane fusion protein (MFP) family protein n=1 Tax=Muricoccus vinaceus TaxID=424704 RepID=A0ABV6IZW5_9PROT